MFYKKADNLGEQENEDEEDGQEGVRVILQGEKKGAASAPATAPNNVVNINDEEEDD